MSHLTLTFTGHHFLQVVFTSEVLEPTRIASVQCSASPDVTWYNPTQRIQPFVNVTFLISAKIQDGGQNLGKKNFSEALYPGPGIPKRSKIYLKLFHL